MTKALLLIALLFGIPAAFAQQAPAAPPKTWALAIHGGAGVIERGALSPEKERAEKIDPQAATFRPTENSPLFFNDILGNTAVVDSMSKLMENRRDEAIGLAFDGRAARETPHTGGFEFRFYRGADSHGWVTGRFGGASYTVANVRLDVRPVTIQGPLYK